MKFPITVFVLADPVPTVCIQTPTLVFREITLRESVAAPPMVFDEPLTIWTPVALPQVRAPQVNRPPAVVPIQLWVMLLLSEVMNTPVERAPSISRPLMV